MRVARNCQNFLTLVLGVPVDVTRIAGRCRPSTWAELITSLTRSNAGRSLYGHDPLLKFEEIPGGAATIVKNWFDVQRDLRDVVALILGSRYVRGYTTTEFLNLTQGLEAFHRRVFQGCYYPAEEYREVRDALAAVVPSGLKPEFQRKLMDLYEYANEFSFRARLRALCETLAPGNRARLGPDVKAFIEKVRKTRNYLTHLDEKEREGSLIADQDDLGDLFRTNLKLNGLATLLLLKHIGVPEELAARGAFRWL